MIHKPSLYSKQNATAFQDESVAAAYQNRPPYPARAFPIVADLIPKKPGRVLDVGCGTGDLARFLVDYVEQVDAVDFSAAMIEQGQQLPNGDHLRLRWITGPIEEVGLEPPYDLVTAGASLHWLDWPVVMPRFRQILRPKHYLAVVSQVLAPDLWSTLGDVVDRYRTDGGFQPYKMLAELEKARLFRQIGETTTPAIPFAQSLDDYIASYHSRSGFSRERMGQVQADAFDREAREILQQTYPTGVITLQVACKIVWGLPG